MLFGELVPKNAALARPDAGRRWPRPARMRMFSRTVRLADPARSTAPRTGWSAGSASSRRKSSPAPARPRSSACSPRSPPGPARCPRDTALLLRRTIRFGDKRAAEAMTPRVDVVGAARRRPPWPICSTPPGRPGGAGSRCTTTPSTRSSASPRSPTRLAYRRRGGRPRRCAAVAREPVFVPESLDLDGVLAALRRGRRRPGDRRRRVRRHRRRRHRRGPRRGAGRRDRRRVRPGRDCDETGAADLTVPGGEQTFLVDGVLREDELAEQTGFQLPEGPYETLAGFLLARLGHIPVGGRDGRGRAAGSSPSSRWRSTASSRCGSGRPGTGDA